jgi:hypothetical protein
MFGRCDGLGFKRSRGRAFSHAENQIANFHLLFLLE